ncbi:serine beta-lactamase-like protein LACTB, mitochondrial [Bradysia coprophila]|uniref:serine beta-lactamase-like protein LACTB, mitochondrial n=1 Tax=Bradysia coprophila TaxID=38358 RepID=UPI00187DCDE2|nr:serine beta-lactamase-like protein LACTB, mitochondrial [Bradysia coprophila]
MVLASIVGLTLLSIFTLSVSCGRTNKTVIDSDPTDNARRLVYNFLNETENKIIPGLVISVSVRGEQKWLEGFGVANIEHNIPMTGDAMMQIASITKSFTVGLASRLMQEGKLDFDVPIKEYLPFHQDVPDKKWNHKIANVTLRQLLQMTAGIPESPEDDEIGKCLRCANQTDRLILMRDKQLDFEPGTNFTYSNYGYELVGAVIESVLDANKTFDGAMTEMIRNIFNLNKTSMISPEMLIPNIASYYYIQNETNSIVNSGMWGELFLNDLHAAGGIMSTMTDVVTYGQIWLDAYFGRSEHFLQQASVKSAWTPTTVSSLPYGMGFVIQNATADTPNDKHVIWHDGGSFGCSSMLAIYPDTEVIVAASVNMGDRSVRSFILDSNFDDLFANIV